MDTDDNSIRKISCAPGELGEDPRLLGNTVANIDAFDLTPTPWRRIWLSSPRGIWCLVDVDDYEHFSAWNWNVGWHVNTPWKFYAKRNVGAARSTVYLAREILIRAQPDLDWPNLVGDHINGQSLDNRKANLRPLTDADNKRNQVGRDRVLSIDTILRKLLTQWSAGDVAGVDIGGTF